MRKLLALLLSVLMLASLLAAIPALAAEQTNETYDGTTKDTVGLNKIIISEIGCNMYYHENRGKETEKTSNLGSMNFVEIYNDGAGNVDLTGLSLLLGVDIQREDDIEEGPYLQVRKQGFPLWSEWSKYHRFVSKMDIKSGALLDADIAQKYADMNSDDGLTMALFNEYFTNAGEDMTLSEGENAVIWLVTPQTIEWMANVVAKNVSMDPKEEFLKSAGVPSENGSYDKYTVVMVWAYSDNKHEIVDGALRKDSGSLAEDMFNFENMPLADEKAVMNYVLGVANSTWQLDETQAYTVNPDKTITINEDLYSVSVLGAREREEQKYAIADDFTVTYAPATAIPYVQNAQNLFVGDTTTYTDYFDAGIVKSYRETGVIHWQSYPTPGMMPEWQWAIVDPTNGKAPADANAAIQKYLKEDLLLDDDGSNAGRDESGITHDYNFESQEDLKNRFNNAKKNNTVNGGGLPTWALILIIVGGVLVVAGGACAVVFLVILPKKKAAAAVSAEEVPVEDAPVEDAPVEETPAAEENE